MLWPRIILRWLRFVRIGRYRMIWLLGLANARPPRRRLLAKRRLLVARLEPDARKIIEYVLAMCVLTWFL